MLRFFAGIPSFFADLQCAFSSLIKGNALGRRQCAELFLQKYYTFLVMLISQHRLTMRTGRRTQLRLTCYAVFRYSQARRFTCQAIRAHAEDPDLDLKVLYLDQCEPNKDLHHEPCTWICWIAGPGSSGSLDLDLGWTNADQTKDRGPYLDQCGPKSYIWSALVQIRFMVLIWFALI